MRNLFTALFCLLSFLAFAQDYAEVDRIVDTYPVDISDAGALSSRINKDFAAPDQKLRAIFRWIATNIAYDQDLAGTINPTAFSYTTDKEKLVKEKKFKADLVSDALRSKKAVCHAYAALVEDLCTRSGLEARIILGDLKSDPAQIGLPPSLNHAWNCVKINNEWRFIDATLGAGFLDSGDKFKFYFNDAYFLPAPERFFWNHFPSDPKWLLLAKSKKEYSDLPVFFGYYLQSKIAILSPLSGIHSLAAGDFKIRLQGMGPDDYLSYSFESENKMEHFEQQDNDAAFTIPMIGKHPDNLLIFINRKIVAIYKITE